MLVVDAGCLFELVAATPDAEPIRNRLADDPEWAAPHAIDVWDAIYVALAEALDATLLTTDGRLARAPGPRCQIECFAPSTPS
jgi:hypothetical protein